MKYLLLLLMMAVSLMVPRQRKNITQGIEGKIYLKQGNQMPSPGRKPDEGTLVVRTVYVYELTQREQAAVNGNFYSNIKTRLVAKAQSGADGHYQIALPVGRYSVFVEESGQLYANLFDGQGNINPVEVKKGNTTPFNIAISNNAVY